MREGRHGDRVRTLSARRGTCAGSGRLRLGEWRAIGDSIAGFFEIGRAEISSRGDMAFRKRRGVRAHRSKYGVGGVRARAQGMSHAHQLRRGGAALHIEQLEPRLVLAANFVINEFLADNGGSLIDNYGARVRLDRNPQQRRRGGQPRRLLPDRRRRVCSPSGSSPAFPLASAGTSWCTRRDWTTSIPAQPLHTNFSLAKEGEYLALVEPDGVTKVDRVLP